MPYICIETPIPRPASYLTFFMKPSFTSTKDIEISLHDNNNFSFFKVTHERLWIDVFYFDRVVKFGDGLADCLTASNKFCTWFCSGVCLHCLEKNPNRPGLFVIYCQCETRVIVLCHFCFVCFCDP